MFQFCPSCGAKILMENAKFCMECGAYFSEFIEKNNSDGSKEEPPSDFFSDINSSDPIDTEDNGFFGNMEDARKKESEADDVLIEEARNLFIRGEVHRSERILLDLVHKGNPFVGYLLALIYEHGGEGVEVDKEKAIEYLLPNGDDSLFGLAALHFFTEYAVGNDSISPEDFGMLVKEIKKNLPNFEALQDDPFILYELGQFYFANNTGMQNYQKSLQYLERSANKGMWPAAFFMGLVYENGMNGKVDCNKAYTCYKKAAQKGMALAARNAGTLIYWGNGVKADRVTAKKWYLVGAKQNDPLCIHQMGIVCEEEGNYREAIEWLERSVSLNDPDIANLSAAELGALYFNLNEIPSIPTNHPHSYQLCKQALSANSKNALAHFYVAVSYLQEDIPELQNLAPEKRSNYFKFHCNKAIQYGDGDIKKVARHALASFEQMERENEHNQNQSANSGCFITTAVCGSFGKPDDCYELTMFRRFRDEWLSRQVDGADLIHEYYNTAPSIVSCINQRGDAGKIYHEIWDKYLSVCLQFIEQNRLDECKQMYVNMVERLKQEYLSNSVKRYH